MKLEFLGTRGEIDVRSRRHRRHSALLVREGSTRILIDCGKDWLRRLTALEPDAIVLTHAHFDHAGGLARGAHCPVYATAETLMLLRSYPLRERRTVALRRPFHFGEFSFEAFSVEHSIRAPAVGYRVCAAGARFFYVPDVVSIHEQHQALEDICLYIGDGAAITRPIVRKRGNVLIGHSSIVAQLGWCAAEHVDEALFTHCGSEIVRGDARRLKSLVRRLGSVRGIKADLAYDGLEISLS